MSSQAVARARTREVAAETEAAASGWWRRFCSPVVDKRGRLGTLGGGVDWIGGGIKEGIAYRLGDRAGRFFGC
jgi:cation transport regulator ChaC